MLNYLLLLIKWPLFAISHLTFRNKSRWLIGSRNGQFVDNPKYLMLHIIEENPEIEITWVTDDIKTIVALNETKLPVVKKWSLKGLWLSLTASVYIYAFDSDDINFFTSGRVRLINLYHGIPLKKIEFDTTVGTSKRVYHPSSLLDKLRSKVLYAPKWQAIDLFQIPSNALKPIHDSAFNHLIREYEIGLNPRLLPLKDDNCHALITADKDNMCQFTRGFESVYIYMPTWRVGAPNIIAEAFPDIKKLNETLAQSNSLLILKMHLYSASILDDCSNIKVFPPEWDVYPFLKHVDVLITDYSSIAFDFAIAGKPIVYYNYDYERYLATSSEGFYFNYDELTANEQISDFPSLLSLLALGTNEKHIMSNAFYNKIWSTGCTESVKTSNTRLVARIKRTLEH